MSRRARHGRHRRRSRTSRTVGTAVPLAVGGVVAGAALVATPFDAGQPRRGDGVTAGPQDRQRGTVITFPGTSMTDRATPNPEASVIPATDRSAAGDGSPASSLIGNETLPGNGPTAGPGGDQAQPSAQSAPPEGRTSPGPGTGSTPPPDSPPPQTPPADPAPPPPTEPPVTLPAPLPSLPLPVVSLPTLP